MTNGEETTTTTTGPGTEQADPNIGQPGAPADAPKQGDEQTQVPDKEKAGDVSE